MTDRPKIFGIGMSKTGTTTLARCLDILRFGPHASFNVELKNWIEEGKDLEPVLQFASKYQTFEDSPWYHLYPYLDQRFPGSKFILTVRKDSLTHAKSSWKHGTRRGQRDGAPTEAYLNEKMRVYQQHNQNVLDYFRDRPEDLLVLCWENGDGWDQLCGFLGVPIPAQPIPHCNQAGRSFVLPAAISGSSFYRSLVKGVYRFWADPRVQRPKALVQEIYKSSKRRLGWA